MKTSVNAIIRSDKSWLMAIFLVALLMRFGAILEFDHTPESDELAYKSMALNLAEGKGIVDSMGNHAMYNVGYPLFVLYPVFLTLGEDLFAVRAINALLGGLAVLLCYAVAKEAGAGRLGSLLAALFWATYLPASVYSVYLAKENLMIPIILAAFLFVLRLLKRPSFLSAVYCGVLFGLLALVGNAAVSLGGALVLALVLSPSPSKQKSVYFATAVMCAALVASPWLIRNFQVLGSPVLNTNSGFNLYTGNNPSATGMFVSIADTPRGDTWHELRQEGEVHASQVLKDEAIDWIFANPSAFVGLAFKKAAYFWTPPLHQGKGKQSSLEKVIRVLWAAQFFLLVIGALATLTVQQLRSREVALIWAAVASYTAVHMLFYVIFRYRLPIMPFLCVMAALSLSALVNRLSPKPEGVRPLHNVLKSSIPLQIDRSSPRTASSVRRSESRHAG